MTVKCPHIRLFALLITAELIACIWGTAGRLIRDSDKQSLWTLDLYQSGNRNVTRHRNLPALPRDAWTVIAGFLDSKSMHSFKATDQLSRVIATEIELDGISLEFRELLETTDLTPWDIVNQFRPYNGLIGCSDDGNKSAIFEFMDRHRLVMIRRHHSGKWMAGDQSPRNGRFRKVHRRS